MDDGMQIAFNDEQPLNAASPRVVIFEPLSKVTVTRFWQSTKHDAPIVSTDEGMRIVLRETQREKADSPKADNLQPLSKVTSNRQMNNPNASKKQHFGMASRDAAMQIDRND
jgi:hypothetical protein